MISPLSWRPDLTQTFCGERGGHRTPPSQPHFTSHPTNHHNVLKTSNSFGTPHHLSPYASSDLIPPQAFRAATRATRPLASAPPTRFLSSTQIRLLSDEMRTAIDKAVSSAPVVLFMKGTPETPQCGFSRASIQILGMQGVDPEKFTAFNVLEDEGLRTGAYIFDTWGCERLVSGHTLEERLSIG